MGTIEDFAKQFCANVPNPTNNVLKTNYEVCYRLAAQWEELIQIHYMECCAETGSEIWSDEKALKATETVARLYMAGNTAYKLYQQHHPVEAQRSNKPTLEQCIDVVKWFRGEKKPGTHCGWDKIGAIKEIRYLTKCPLKESKEFVKAVDREYPLDPQSARDNLGDALIAEAEDREAGY